MAEGHVCCAVMDVCETDPGVGDSDQDLVFLERGAVGCGFLDAAVFGAFVDCEVVAHFLFLFVFLFFLLTLCLGLGLGLGLVWG